MLHFAKRLKALSSSYDFTSFFLLSIQGQIGHPKRKKFTLAKPCSLRKETFITFNGQQQNFASYENRFKDGTGKTVFRNHSG